MPLVYASLVRMLSHQSSGDLQPRVLKQPSSPSSWTNEDLSPSLEANNLWPDLTLFPSLSLSD